MGLSKQGEEPEARGVADGSNVGSTHFRKAYVRGEFLAITRGFDTTKEGGVAAKIVRAQRRWSDDDEATLELSKICIPA